MDQHVTKRSFIVFYDYRQGSLSSRASHFCQTALGIILHRIIRFISGTSNFSSAERRLRRWPLLPNKLWQKWNVWTKRTMINRKWDKSFNLSSASLSRIFRHHPGVWKGCFRWVPHKLTEEEKRGRMKWFLHMLRNFDGGISERVWDIVTGNELLLSFQTVFTFVNAAVVCAILESISALESSSALT